MLFALFKRSYGPTKIQWSVINMSFEFGTNNLLKTRIWDILSCLESVNNLKSTFYTLITSIEPTYIIGHDQNLILQYFTILFTIVGV